jgi:TRAP-type mannitol/chloroaromatic compound transport system permease small subunit
MLLRSAATAPTVPRRVRDWALLMGFIFFWICTLLAPKLYGDDIVYDHFICVMLLLFLGAWILAWVPWDLVIAKWRARQGSEHSGGGATPQPQPPAV